MSENDTKIYVKQHGNCLASASDAYNLALNLNISELLALQKQYTELQCECRRFVDWVMNLSINCCADAIRFENDYLNIAANKLIAKFRTKTEAEKSAEAEVLSDMINEAVKYTIAKKE